MSFAGKAAICVATGSSCCSKKMGRSLALTLRRRMVAGMSDREGVDAVASLLIQPRAELARGDDSNSAIGAECQQMLVPADDAPRASRERCFEEFVIGRIGFDSEDGFQWSDKFGFVQQERSEIVQLSAPPRYADTMTLVSMTTRISGPRARREFRPRSPRA